MDASCGATFQACLHASELRAIDPLEVTVRFSIHAMTESVCTQEPMRRRALQLCAFYNPVALAPVPRYLALGVLAALAPAVRCLRGALRARGAVACPVRALLGVEPREQNAAFQLVPGHVAAGAPHLAAVVLALDQVLAELVVPDAVPAALRPLAAAGLLLRGRAPPSDAERRPQHRQQEHGPHVQGAAPAGSPGGTRHPQHRGCRPPGGARSQTTWTTLPGAAWLHNRPEHNC
mmetsp:Transcript_100885/g.285935  ORF Transcript_100885/g.285935 Transcript_100885/m.285935 type:complete len:234 (+) Transcript_100885:280-981(+)